MDKPLKDQLSKAPHSPGVYLFKDKNGTVLYVGKAINLAHRLAFYKKNRDLEPKINAMVSLADSISTITVKSEIEALLLEINLIKRFRPKFNVIWMDDKRPIWIAVSRETFPRVYLSRKVSEKEYFLYGPFPSVAKTRQILSYARKIFPFHSEKQDKKVCFWLHLGLCNPCPAAIVKTADPLKETLTRRYQRNIYYLKLFLSGKIKSTLQELSREMLREAKQDHFETAAGLRDKLNLLQFLVDSKTNLNDYLNKPSLLSDFGKASVANLADILKISNLSRIEAYDIANISGKFATGSMVVFKDGIPDNREYRRFKIKQSDTPNDPQMLAEVLERRLKHHEWDLPQLVLVDGGKAQVTKSLEILDCAGIKIPVIGLTKRNEELIIPDQKGFSVYRLKADSSALHLLQNLRDESHRFATSYHKKLRLKYLTTKPK